MIVEHRFPVALPAEDFYASATGALESLGFVVAMPCSKCGYELRGSLESRDTCPECGATAASTFHHDQSRLFPSIVILASQGQGWDTINLRLQFEGDACSLACWKRDGALDVMDQSRMLGAVRAVVSHFATDQGDPAARLPLDPRHAAGAGKDAQAESWLDGFIVPGQITLFVLGVLQFIGAARLGTLLLENSTMESTSILMSQGLLICLGLVFLGSALWSLHDPYSAFVVAALVYMGGAIFDVMGVAAKLELAIAFATYKLGMVAWLAMCAVLAAKAPRHAMPH